MELPKIKQLGSSSLMRVSLSPNYCSIVEKDLITDQAGAEDNTGNVFLDRECQAWFYGVLWCITRHLLA
jgi:hypothetical protein